MKRAIIFVLALAAAGACWADLTRGEWKIARPIILPKITGAGLAYLPLDEDALRVKSLAEYRIVEEGREEAPYRMVLEGGESEAKSVPAKVVSRSLPGQTGAEITVDLGEEAPPANQVELLLNGDNFRSKVRVEGSRERVRWWLLVAGGIVYRHEGRYEQTTVALPPNDYRFLRITVVRLQGNLPLIEGAQVSSILQIPRKLVAVGSRLSRREDTKNRLTLLDIDLNRPTRDIMTAEFEIQEKSVDRPLTIEFAQEGMGYEWAGEANLRRLKAGEKVSISLDIPYARRLRLQISNGDDRPLTISKVTLWRVRRGLIFSADPSHRYELWYGRPQAPEPNYEIQRLPILTPPAELPVASLGPEHSLPVKPPPPPPWSEQHPVIFWAALAAVVLLLALLILRTMRGVRADHG